MVCITLSTIHLINHSNFPAHAAFYASVEIRDDPSLKGKPLGVGDSHMLTTASYEARKFGVRSAMPGFIAKQLCPELVFVRPNFKKYKESSDQTRGVMAEYDPNVRVTSNSQIGRLCRVLIACLQFEPYSLDEAALDLTGYLKKHPGRSVEEVAEEIKDKIFEFVFNHRSIII
jgi:DNA polymerase kappa